MERLILRDRMRGSRPAKPLAAAVLALVSAGWEAAVADEALHVRIDRRADEIAGIGGIPVCDDATFLRRTFATLAGTVPTAEEARAFLDDGDLGKRAKLVERLVASRASARHLAMVFDVMLMERRDERHVKTPEWREFLYASFLEDKPFDRLAREILGADGTDDKGRAAARFFLDREVDTHLLTRDVGRLFLGMDLQCAQCHDHPRIDDYTQHDYYGLHAFLSRSHLFQPDTNKPALVAENADGATEFTSVFTKLTDATPPRIPGGDDVPDPAISGEPWAVPPNEKDKSVRPVPAYSRLQQLPERLVGAGNPRFARNLANRLWAHMMGRGLVEPLDLDHAENPPVDPVMLDLVTEGVVELGFDVRAILAELARTKVFQRPLGPPEDLGSWRVAATERIESLTGEAESLRVAASAAKDRLRECRESIDERLREAAPVRAEAGKAAEALAAAAKAHDEAAGKVSAAEAALVAKSELRKSLEEAAVAAEGAAGVIGDPAGVAAAAETFRAKAEAAGNDLPSLEKAVGEARGALEAPAAALAEAERVMKEAAARREGADAAVREARLAEREASTEWATHESRLRLAGLRLEESRAVVAAADAIAAEAAARGRLEALESEGGRVGARRAELAASIADLRTASGEAAAAFASAEDADAAAREAASAHAGPLAKLEEAVAKAAAAAAMAGEDADIASAVGQLTAARDKAKEGAARVAEEAAAAAETLAAARSRAESAKERLAEVEKELIALAARAEELEAGSAAVATTLEEARVARESAQAALVDAWTRAFILRPLDPLGPEELAWSMMAATGQWDRFRQSAEAEFDKNHEEAVKKAAEEKKDAPPEPTEAERLAGIERLFEAKIKGTVDQFVRLFGNGAGQPENGFFATADQALYLENSGVPRNWLGPSGDNVTARAAALEDPAAVAEELFLALLTRRPTPDEIELVRDHLERRADDRRGALQDLGWALLTSNEFRFIH